MRYAYTRGGITIIDLLDAQRNWYDTRKMYYDALHNYRKSYLQLTISCLFITVFTLLISACGSGEQRKAYAPAAARPVIKNNGTVIAFPADTVTQRFF